MPPSKKTSSQTADSQENTTDLVASKSAPESTADVVSQDSIPPEILKIILNPEQIVRRLKKNVGVIIADDHRDVGEMIRTYLVRSLGFKSLNVHLVADGHEALELIRADDSKNIKLVISDVRMPTMNGLELIKQLRESRGDVTRVLMSAYSEDISLKDARDAQLHLEKPFEVKDIRKVVTDALMNMRNEIGYREAVEELLDEYLKSQANKLRKKDIKIASLSAAIKEFICLMKGKLDLSKYSKPYNNFESEAFTLFKGHTQEHRILGEDDWENSRGIEGTSVLFGLKNIVEFEKMFSANTDQDIQGITCHCGGGTYSITDEFIEQGSLNYQVGIADSIVYKPSEILDRALVYNQLNSDETAALVAIYNSTASQNQFHVQQLQVIEKLLNNTLLINHLTDPDASTVQSIIKKLSDELNQDEISTLAMISTRSDLPNISDGNKLELIEDIIQKHADQMDAEELRVLNSFISKPLYIDKLGRRGRVMLKSFLSRLMNDAKLSGIAPEHREVIQGLVSKLSSLNEFLKINGRLQTLLLDCFGRWGRLVIDLNVPEDQIRFRDYLMRLYDENKRLKKLAQGKRYYKGTTGKFQGDKNSNISRPEIPFFKEMGRIGIVAWFKKHYKSILQMDSNEDFRDMLDAVKCDVYFMDFKDIPKNLKDKEQIFSFVVAAKSFSHLESHDYAVCMNEMATRLVSGGAMICDVQESYTDYIQLKALHAMKENIGNEYKMTFIGDKNGPVDVIVQRGKLTDEGNYKFLEEKQMASQLKQGYKMVPLEDFSITWPLLALKNKVIQKIKAKIFDEVTYNIEENDMNPEFVQTYRHKHFKKIRPHLANAYNASFVKVFGRKAPKRKYMRAFNRAISENKIDEFIENTSEQLFERMNKTAA